MTQLIITATLAAALYFDFLPRLKAPDRDKGALALYVLLTAAGYIILLLASFDLLPSLMEPLIHLMEDVLHLP